MPWSENVMRFSVGKLSYFNTLMWAEGGGLQTSQQKLHGPNCQNQPRTWTKIGARGCYRQQRKYICMITYKYSHQELYHDKFKFRLISPYLVRLVPSSYHFPFFYSALIFSIFSFKYSLSPSLTALLHIFKPGKLKKLIRSSSVGQRRTIVLVKVARHHSH